MHLIEAKGILSAQNGMNVYRGCTHGCIYCDSRSRCYQIEHEFTDVAAKINAPQLLEAALRKKRKKCMIFTGSMCDPYNGCERELGLTRACLEVIERCGFGAGVLTKSADVLRDLDRYRRIHERARCVVQMTLTTADEALCRIVEPNVSTTAERVAALKAFAKAGVPTVVWFCPQLPYINDTPENVAAIVDACAEAGVCGIVTFGMGLTLREGDREYYYQCLDRHFPGLKERYMRRYGYAYELPSDNADALWRVFRARCKRHGIESDPARVFAFLSSFPEEKQTGQMRLFD